MVFRAQGLLGGLALLMGSTVAAPGMAQSGPHKAQSVPHNQMWLSQENRPETEGIPQLTSQEVRGTVVSVDPNSERVELRLSSGELRTYRITKADQERNRLQAGAVVVLTVRDETVIAIRPESATTETDTTGSASSSTTTSGSSTTIIRRETTVQPTRPAPAAQPEPQSVRGLW